MGLCLLLPSQGATSSLLLSPFSPSPLALLSSPRPLIFLSHSYSDYISPWLLFLSVFLFLVYRILPRAATATLSPNISFCQETFLPPPPTPFLISSLYVLLYPHNAYPSLFVSVSLPIHLMFFLFHIRTNISLFDPPPPCLSIHPI